MQGGVHEYVCHTDSGQSNLVIIGSFLFFTFTELTKFQTLDGHAFIYRCITYSHQTNFGHILTNDK